MIPPPPQVTVWLSPLAGWIAAMDMDPPACPSPQHDVCPPESPAQLGADRDPVSDLKQAAVTCLRVHLYHVSRGGSGGASGGDVLTYPPGDYVAEALCVDAAKACGGLGRVQPAHMHTHYGLWWWNTSRLILASGKTL